MRRAQAAASSAPASASSAMTWSHRTTAVGVLRLRFRGPVELSERERYTLRTFASALGIPSSVRQDNIAGFVVELPDSLDDAQQEALEAEYEAIMDAQMLAAEADDELVSHHAAGIMVTLSAVPTTV